MIHVDAEGNRFIVTDGGTKLPLVPVPVNVKIEIETVNSGLIVSVSDSLAIDRTLAVHWYTKYQEALTTIADLRAQLNAK